MSDTAPLKHVVEPGEYRCVWTVPDEDGNSRQIHGEIELRVDRPPRGSAYGDVPLKVTGQGSESMTTYPQRHYFPSLLRELVSGQKIMLIDASFHVWNFDRAVIGARAALVGSWEPNAADSFDRARIQVSGLDSLAGISPIRSFEFPMENTLSGRWGAEAEPERFQEWSDSTANVELGYIGSASIGDPFKFSLAFSPSFTLTLDQARSLDVIVDDWVSPLQKLAALCIGQKSQVTFVALGSGEPTYQWSQLYGVGIYQNPYASSRSELLDIQPAFTAKGDEISPLELMRSWQKVASEHHPLIETYGTFLSVTTIEHPRNRFLQLIQALEGLHGYEYADTSRFA